MSRQVCQVVSGSFMRFIILSVGGSATPKTESLIAIKAKKKNIEKKKKNYV